MNKSIVLIYLIIFCSICNASQTQVFFTEPSSESHVAEKLVRFIDSATSTIEGSFYQVDNESIINAFIRAAHRLGAGKVRLVNESSYYNHTKYKKYFQQMEAAGIVFVTDDADGTDRGLCHNKFCIADRKRVWTGSTNITNSGMNRNNNNALWIDSSELAAIFLKEFEEMYTDKKFSRKKSDNTLHTFHLDGRKAEVYFSPTDGARERLIEIINTAEHSIHFSIFTFTDKNIADAIIARHKQGVKVIGVYDAFQANSSYCTIHEMRKNNITTVLTDANKGLCHHKFLAVDANTNSNPAVFTGSLNFTSSGDYSNDENSLIIHDPTVVKLYAAETEKLYIQAGGSLHSSKMDLIISKVSFNVTNGDWIELYCKDDGNSGKGASMENYSVEVDKTIFSFSAAHICKTGDFIVIKDEGSEIPSGENVYTTSVKIVTTDEQVLLRNKQDNSITDAVCWANNDGKIIDSEIEDLTEISNAQQWDGAKEHSCIDSSNVQKNYVLSRDREFTDTNSSQDWIVSLLKPGEFPTEMSSAYLNPDRSTVEQLSCILLAADSEPLPYQIKAFCRLQDICSYSFESNDFAPVYTITETVKESEMPISSPLKTIISSIRENISVAGFIRGTDYTGLSECIDSIE